VPPSNSAWIQNVYASMGLPSILVYPPVDAEAYATVSSREYVTLVNLSRDKGGAVLDRIAALMPDVKFLGVRGAYEQQIESRSENVTVVDNTPNIKAIYER